jgi:ferrous iron transport protein A
MLTQKFTQKFSVCFSPLSLLKEKERGIISHIRERDEIEIDRLADMGIVPGAIVMLKQRFPSLSIHLGEHCLEIDRDLAKSIYVRIGS